MHSYGKSIHFSFILQVEIRVQAYQFLMLDCLRLIDDEKPLKFLQKHKTT